MKNFLSFIILLVFVQISFAQQSKDFFYVSVNAGPSFPIGEFASNDANNPGAGYANIGIKGEVTAGINLTPNVGLLAEFFVNSNGIKSKDIESSLGQIFPGYTWSDNSKSWSIFGFFTGISVRTPIRKNASVFINAFGGYINSKSPDFSLSGDSANLRADYLMSSVTTSAITYKVTGGLEFKTGLKTAIYGIIEYIGSKPTFKDVNISQRIYDKTTGGTIRTNEAKTSFDQTLGVFNIGLGFKYFLY